MDTLTVLHLKGVRQEQLWPQTAVLSSFSSAASIRTTQADIRTSSKVQILYYQIISYIIKNSPRPLVVRRWWLCLPWIILYGLNIIGLFASGIVAFYQLTNNLKLVGLLPLAYGQLRHFTPRFYNQFAGCFLLVFYILVVFFVLEQKHKLSGIAVRPLPSISSLVSR